MARDPKGRRPCSQCGFYYELGRSDERKATTQSISKMTDEQFDVYLKNLSAAHAVYQEREAKAQEDIQEIEELLKESAFVEEKPSVLPGIQAALKVSCALGLGAPEAVRRECKNCEYYFKQDGYDSESIEHCRLAPQPVVIVGDHWCGQFKAK